MNFNELTIRELKILDEMTNNLIIAMFYGREAYKITLALREAYCLGKKIGKREK